MDYPKQKLARLVEYAEGGNIWCDTGSEALALIKAEPSIRLGDWIAYERIEAGQPPRLLGTRHVSSPQTENWQLSACHWFDKKISAKKSVSRRQMLRWRHLILKGIREFFDNLGYIEVDTPILVSEANPEAQFQLFKTDQRFLITSPELEMKRLLVGGFDKVYRLGAVFRAQEQGQQHQPQFCMLEWYERGISLTVLRQQTEQLIAYLINQLQANDAPTAAITKVFAAPYPQFRVNQLFKEYFDIGNYRSIEQLQNALAAINTGGASLHNDASQLNYVDCFSLLWDYIEQKLPATAQWISGFPLELASLAKECPSGEANRTELIAQNTEICNGFNELIDAKECAKRFDEQLRQRQQRGMPTPDYALFLRSMQSGLPPCAGMALGVDRLLMLLCGAENIADVVSFSWDEC